MRGITLAKVEKVVEAIQGDYIKPGRFKMFLSGTKITEPEFDLINSKLKNAEYKLDAKKIYHEIIEEEAEVEIEEMAGKEEDEWACRKN